MTFCWHWKDHFKFIFSLPCFGGWKYIQKTWSHFAHLLPGTQESTTRFASCYLNYIYIFPKTKSSNSSLSGTAYCCFLPRCSHFRSQGFNLESTCRKINFCTISGSLRILGSRNWWFGDPRTLLYRVKPLYRRVPMILRVGHLFWTNWNFPMQTARSVPLWVIVGEALFGWPGVGWVTSGRSGQLTLFIPFSLCIPPKYNILDPKVKVWKMYLVFKFHVGFQGRRE